MSLRPRIFVSTVSSEFGQARQLVANILQKLGYEPVFQEIFGTEPGDLRQVLREQIDSCEGLVQLVGRAYGAEPPTVEAEFGRVSYTQFEFLYAKSRGKKTWLLLAQDGCERDGSLDELDLPTRSSGMAIPGLPALSAAPEAYQAERRALQDAYRERLQQSEHLWHPVNDLSGLQLVVRDLRDDYAQLRRGFRSWQRTVLRLAAALLSLLVIVGLGVWWTVFRQPAEIAKVVDDSAAKVTETIQTTAAETTEKVAAKVVEQLADPAQIRLQLQKTIETTYQRELAEADALPDWEKRDAAKKEVTAARDKRLSEIDEFIVSVTSTLKSGDASPEYRELNRVIQEQGVAAALKYIASQEERLLAEARQLAQAAKQKIRQKLAPLLESAKLLMTRGDYHAARQRCEELLGADETWRDVRHERFWVLRELGDRALRYETVSAARRYFDAAGRTAELAAAADPTDAQAQRTLSISYERLGEVTRRSGDTQAALGYFQQMHKINQKLAAADPNDAQAQRALSVSYNDLGYVALRSGDSQAALWFYQQGLDVRQKLAAADPTDAQAQRDLAISYTNLGDVTRRSGDTQAALGFYQRMHKIDQKLAAADPNDAQAQRALSISYERLGDVTLQSGDTQAALGYFQQMHKINQQLAAADPSDAQAQGDLAVSYDRLGDIMLQRGDTQAALGYFRQSLEIDQKLAAADPTDAQVQRALSISYVLLGDVTLQSGDTQAALGFFQQGLDIRQKLAAADPTDAQAQRALSISYERLGDVTLQSGDTQAALGYFQQALEITQKLAAADPTDAQAQRGLSFSYERLGDVTLQSGDTQAALGYFQQMHKINQKLAAADPNDAQAQRDLSFSYVRLGDVTLQSGDTQAALGYFQQALEIRQNLAAADPTDAEAQRDLMVSHYKLGGVRQADGEFAAAADNYRAGMAVLDQMIAAGQHVEQSQKERGILLKQVQDCEEAPIALGEWATLLEQPADMLPAMLSMRCTWLAKKQHTADVAQAAAHLQTLEPVTAGNLYNAACGFGLCLKLVSGWDGKSNFPPKEGIPDGTPEEQATRQEYRAKALAAFQAAVEQGYDKFDDARKDADLAALQGDAEFQALLKTDATK